MNSRTIDNLLTLRILTMLVTSFEEFPAFHLGIIDKNGNNLIPSKKFTTSEQKNSYTYLDRLVINIKKLINRLPGGENKIKNLVSAYVLIKECYTNSVKSPEQSRLFEIHDKLNNITLVEETLLIEDVISANNTSNVSNVELPISSIVKRYKKKLIKK